MFRIVLGGILVALVMPGCGGQRHNEHGLEFRDWFVVKPIVPGTGSVSYGKILNKSGAAQTLKAADFACAASTALHETVTTGDRVRMLPLPAPEIADGTSLAFEPGHKHIMLGTLKPETGETCEAAFTFNSVTVKFRMPVKPREK